jgi:cell wall-associated NlpC family hydrolase
MKYSIIIAVLCLFLSELALGQDKKIDKLEMLYDQGNYDIVLRRSEKLMRTPGYEKHPSPVLFHALAEYQVGKDNEKFSSSQAIYDYEKFLILDSLDYYKKAYSNYIYDLQLGIANEIRVLNESGNNEKAKVKYDSYVRLFGNVAQFEELVITNVEVTPTETSTPNVPITKQKVRDGVIKEANKHIGTPYKYGGITPKGFDCSGFTQYVYSKNGEQLPRTADAQSSTYQTVKIGKAQKGDLVFFGSSKNNISHVGIVVSNNPLVMIHASSSRGIMISNVDADPYWKPKLQFAVTVLDK